MKKNLLLVKLLLCSIILNAQDYTFSLSNSTYSELSNPIVLTDPNEPWDDPELFIPFNFPFTFFGNTVNGFYTAFGLGSELYTTNNELEDNSPLLTPLLTDIIDRGFLEGTSVSSISYEVTGNSGNRILKLQWKNVGLYDDLTENSISTDFLNYQVWFYETSNVIEMHYGECFISNLDFYLLNVALIKKVGLQSFLIEDIHYLTGLANNPNFVVSSDFETFMDNTIIGLPSANTVYVFSPISSPLNMESTDLLSHIQVYPNPSSDNITIVSDFEIEKIVIRDIMGKVIMTNNGNQKIVSLKLLPSGNYSVEVQTMHGLEIKKIVKI
jgi:hypothetical protein